MFVKITEPMLWTAPQWVASTQTGIALTGDVAKALDLDDAVEVAVQLRKMIPGAVVTLEEKAMNA